MRPIKVWSPASCSGRGNGKFLKTQSPQPHFWQKWHASSLVFFDPVKMVSLPQQKQSGSWLGIFDYSFFLKTYSSAEDTVRPSSSKKGECEREKIISYWENSNYLCPINMTCLALRKLDSICLAFSLVKVAPRLKIFSLSWSLSFTASMNIRSN